jgi:hypothetical protein
MWRGRSQLLWEAGWLGRIGFFSPYWRGGAVDVEQVAMPVRRIIESAAFGPELVKAAGEAFDAAWSEIADRFDANSCDTAREVLAISIISAAREQQANSQLLRRAGLDAMARAFPDRLAPTAARDMNSQRQN